MNCQICQRPSLAEIEEFSQLPRVTSDCKAFRSGGRLSVCLACGATQKFADQTWLKETREIYENYELYELSEGAEQIIYVNGTATARSRLLLDFLLRSWSLPATGKLIDIGCGNGAALANFSSALPGWKLYGTELSNNAAPHLSTLKNFVRLFVGPSPEIQEKFELITMIHSLEHMPTPASTISNIRDLAMPDGALFVEVPDHESSLFDLIVADHLMHFTASSLRQLLGRTGFCMEFVSNKVLPKELTAIARLGNPKVDQSQPHGALEFAKRRVKWLSDVLHQAQVSKRGTRFGIFGTAISGTWLFGSMKEDIDFFVDEDASRIGKSIEGRPILDPRAAPRNSTVFIPMAPALASRIAERYAAGQAQFVPAAGPS